MKGNLVAQYETADGNVEIHGLNGGYTVFVGERMVQKDLNGREIVCYLCHVLQAAHHKLPQYVSREPIAWAVYDEGNDELLGAVILKPENEDTAGLRYEPLYISGGSS